MKQGIQIKPLSPNNISVVPTNWLDGLDSSQFTLDGTYVDNWACKGSLAADVVNTNNDATRPTYDASTGRVTFIDANNTFLQSAAFGSALSQPNTVFIVYAITGVLSDNEAVFDARTTLGQMINFSASVYNMYAGAGPITGGTTDANNTIHCAFFNTTSSEYWINGVSVTSGNVGTGTLDGVTLGARGNLSFNADCSISEVIVYNSKLPFHENYGLYLGLREKWNI